MSVWINWSYYQRLYKFILGFFFQSCSFSHTKRAGNSVAHALAKRVRKSSPLLVWIETVPPNISYLVFVNVNLLVISLMKLVDVFLKK